MAASTEQLYAEHHALVRGLCRALLRDATEAEDASQQTFLSAHRALLNGAHPREPAAWLATIARNECWSRTRARMREPLPSADVEEAAGSDDPLAAALLRADLSAIWRALRALPPAQREAVLLREFGGLSYGELALALATTEPAVESLLFRARARLRAQLRAAHGSLSGAGWLEGLLRLVGGSAAPAAAAKVAAVGLGTAVVTGGAVVTPTMLEHHRRPYVPQHRTVTKSTKPAKQLTVVAVVAPVQPRTVTPAATATPAITIERRHRKPRRERAAAVTTVESVADQDNSGPGSAESGRDGDRIDSSGPGGGGGDSSGHGG